MADEQNVNPAQEDEKPDYEALYKQAVEQSRKWESRAKTNKDKADRWDAATKDSDSIEERIAKLEKENQSMKDAKARRELVSKVAAATGLSESIVASLSGTDEEALTEQAEAVAALKPKGGPSAPEAGTFPRDEVNTKTNAKKFGDAFDKLLGR